MLILILHWISCGWYFIFRDAGTWYPLKDLDIERTILYDEPEVDSPKAGPVSIYELLFYYAALILVGNELMPTSGVEVGMAAVITMIGIIVLGVIIGQFSSILSDMSKKQRLANEEFDLLSSVMQSLKIPEPT
jgi:hypothetical protein